MSKHDPLTTSLDQMKTGASAEVTAIDWETLSPRDAARLRNFGFDTGVTVCPLHRAPFGADPLAVKVGRMTVAIRRAHAAAVRVKVRQPA